MLPTVSETLRATMPWVPTRAIGQPSNPDSAAMPSVVPMPNKARYRRRAAMDGIVAITSAVSAPLPARPCTAPTSSGRRASDHELPDEDGRDTAPCTWECVGPVGPVGEVPADR